MSMRTHWQSAQKGANGYGKDGYNSEAAYKGVRYIRAAWMELVRWSLFSDDGFFDVLRLGTLHSVESIRFCH